MSASSTRSILETNLILRRSERFVRIMARQGRRPSEEKSAVAPRRAGFEG